MKLGLLPFIMFANVMWGQGLDGKILSVVDSTDVNNMVLIQSLVIKAPVEQVWDAYTTSEGWMNWAAPLASIDLRIGGSIKSNYNRESSLEDEGTINLHIINFVPQKVLTLQAEITANFPEFMQDDEKRLYNIILFEEVNGLQTKITSYGIGYRRNNKYRNMMKFFISGNELSMYQLRDYLEKGKTIKE